MRLQRRLYGIYSVFFPYTFVVTYSCALSEILENAILRQYLRPKPKFNLKTVLSDKSSLKSHLINSWRRSDFAVGRKVGRSEVQEGGCCVCHITKILESISRLFLGHTVNFHIYVFCTLGVFPVNIWSIYHHSFSLQTRFYVYTQCINTFSQHSFSRSTQMRQIERQMLPPYYFYWFRIDTKHMTEP